MMLDIKEVARLLYVSEKTVYRWLSKNEIPAYKIGEGYRFNKVELLEWATAKKIKVSPEIFEENLETFEPMPSLIDALSRGGIHYRIPGNDKQSILKSIVGIINLPEDVDKSHLLEALIARENLGTTAIGDGIAIPHVRNPIILHVNKPILALCFLEQGVEFNAVDKKPVNTVFTIITHTVRSHLHILSRLGFALHQPQLRSVINGNSSRDEIIGSLTELEKNLNHNT